MSGDAQTIQTAFGRSRVLLPVIHPVSREIALDSIATAVRCGADGVFLINQGMSTHELLDLIPEAHRRHDENLWIGVNLLGTAPEDVVGLVAELPVGGIWSDNAGIEECSDSRSAGERFRLARRGTGWDGLYFGGVAFKYQREVPDDRLPDAARAAAPWMDVITSSGPGTGHAASVDKVRSLHAGAGSCPLALASGVTPENVDAFLPYIEAYLVASGIETSTYSGVLLPERTELLARRIHAWAPDK